MARIIERTPVPVVPLALKGLWGSFFSRENGRAMTRLFGPGRIARRIGLEAAPPIPAPEVDPDALQDTVLQLRGAWR